MDEPLVAAAFAPQKVCKGFDSSRRVAGQAINLCLAGLVAAIRLTSLLGMGMLRNTFVTSVARFTMLHAPSQMAVKHARALRALLVAADENGNHLHVSCRLSDHC